MPQQPQQQQRSTPKPTTASLFGDRPVAARGAATPQPTGTALRSHSTTAHVSSSITSVTRGLARPVGMTSTTPTPTATQRKAMADRGRARLDMAEARKQRSAGSGLLGSIQPPPPSDLQDTLRSAKNVTVWGDVDATASSLPLSMRHIAAAAATTRAQALHGARAVNVGSLNLSKPPPPAMLGSHASMRLLHEDAVESRLREPVEETVAARVVRLAREAHEACAVDAMLHDGSKLLLASGTDGAQRDMRVGSDTWRWVRSASAVEATRHYHHHDDDDGRAEGADDAPHGAAADPVLDHEAASHVATEAVWRHLFGASDAAVTPGRSRRGRRHVPTATLASPERAAVSPERTATARSPERDATTNAAATTAAKKGPLTTLNVKLYCTMPPEDAAEAEIARRNPTLPVVRSRTLEWVDSVAQAGRGATTVGTSDRVLRCAWEIVHATNAAVHDAVALAAESANPDAAPGIALHDAAVSLRMQLPMLDIGEESYGDRSASHRQHHHTLSKQSDATSSGSYGMTTEEQNHALDLAIELVEKQERDRVTLVRQRSHASAATPVSAAQRADSHGHSPQRRSSSVKRAASTATARSDAAVGDGAVAAAARAPRRRVTVAAPTFIDVETDGESSDDEGPAPQQRSHSLSADAGGAPGPVDDATPMAHLISMLRKTRKAHAVAHAGDAKAAATAAWAQSVNMPSLRGAPGRLSVLDASTTPTSTSSPSPAIGVRGNPAGSDGHVSGEQSASGSPRLAARGSSLSPAALASRRAVPLAAGNGSVRASSSHSLRRADLSSSPRHSSKRLLLGGPGSPKAGSMRSTASFSGAGSPRARRSVSSLASAASPRSGARRSVSSTGSGAFDVSGAGSPRRRRLNDNFGMLPDMVGDDDAGADLAATVTGAWGHAVEEHDAFRSRSPSPRSVVDSPQAASDAGGDFGAVSGFRDVTAFSPTPHDSPIATDVAPPAPIDTAHGMSTSRRSYDEDDAATATPHAAFADGDPFTADDVVPPAALGAWRRPTITVSAVVGDTGDDTTTRTIDGDQTDTARPFSDSGGGAGGSQSATPKARPRRQRVSIVAETFSDFDVLSGTSSGGGKAASTTATMTSGGGAGAPRRRDSLARSDASASGSRRGSMVGGGKRSATLSFKALKARRMSKARTIAPHLVDLIDAMKMPVGNVEDVMRTSCVFRPHGMQLEHILRRKLYADVAAQREREAKLREKERRKLQRDRMAVRRASFAPESMLTTFRRRSIGVASTGSNNSHTGDDDDDGGGGAHAALHAGRRSSVASQRSVASILDDAEGPTAKPAPVKTDFSMTDVATGESPIADGFAVYLALRDAEELQRNRLPFSHSHVHPSRCAELAMDDAYLRPFPPPVELSQPSVAEMEAAADSADPVAPPTASGAAPVVGAQPIVGFAGQPAGGGSSSSSTARKPPPDDEMELDATSIVERAIRRPLSRRPRCGSVLSEAMIAIFETEDAAATTGSEARRRSSVAVSEALERHSSDSDCIDDLATTPEAEHPRQQQRRRESMAFLTTADAAGTLTSQARRRSSVAASAAALLGARQRKRDAKRAALTLACGDLSDSSIDDAGMTDEQYDAAVVAMRFARLRQRQQDRDELTIAQRRAQRKQRRAARQARRAARNDIASREIFGRQLLIDACRAGTWNSVYNALLDAHLCGAADVMAQHARLRELHATFTAFCDRFVQDHVQCILHHAAVGDGKALVFHGVVFTVADAAFPHTAGLDAEADAAARAAAEASSSPDGSPRASRFPTTAAAPPPATNESIFGASSIRGGFHGGDMTTSSDTHAAQKARHFRALHHAPHVMASKFAAAEVHVISAVHQGWWKHTQPAPLATLRGALSTDDAAATAMHDRGLLLKALQPAVGLVAPAEAPGSPKKTFAPALAVDPSPRNNRASPSRRLAADIRPEQRAAQLRALHQEVSGDTAAYQRVRFPLQCVLHFAGHTIVCSAQLPADLFPVEIVRPALRPEPESGDERFLSLNPPAGPVHGVLPLQCPPSVARCLASMARELRIANYAVTTKNTGDLDGSRSDQNAVTDDDEEAAYKAEVSQKALVHLSHNTQLRYSPQEGTYYVVRCGSWLPAGPSGATDRNAGGALGGRLAQPTEASRAPGIARPTTPPANASLFTPPSFMTQPPPALHAAGQPAPPRGSVGTMVSASTLMDAAMMAVSGQQGASLPIAQLRLRPELLATANDCIACDVSAPLGRLRERDLASAYGDDGDHTTVSAVAEAWDQELSFNFRDPASAPLIATVPTDAMAASSASSSRAVKWTSTHDVCGRPLLQLQLLRATRRVAFKHMRDVVTELCSPSHDVGISGKYVCEVLHTRGINLRWLGAAADIAHDRLRGLRALPDADVTLIDAVDRFLAVVKQEMSVRVFRGVLRRTLAVAAQRFVCFQTRADNEVDDDADDGRSGGNDAHASTGFFAHGQFGGGYDTSTCASSDDDDDDIVDTSAMANAVSGFFGRNTSFSFGTRAAVKHPAEYGSRAASDALAKLQRKVATTLVQSFLGSELESRTQRFWSSVIVPALRRKYAFYGSVARSELQTGPAISRLEQVCKLALAAPDAASVKNGGGDASAGLDRSMSPDRRPVSPNTVQDGSPVRSSVGSLARARRGGGGASGVNPAYNRPPRAKREVVADRRARASATLDRGVAPEDPDAPVLKASLLQNRACRLGAVVALRPKIVQCAVPPMPELPPHAFDASPANAVIADRIYAEWIAPSLCVMHAAMPETASPDSPTTRAAATFGATTTGATAASKELTILNVIDEEAIARRKVLPPITRVHNTIGSRPPSAPAVALARLPPSLAGSASNSREASRAPSASRERSATRPASRAGSTTAGGARPPKAGAAATALRTSKRDAAKAAAGKTDGAGSSHPPARALGGGAVTSHDGRPLYHYITLRRCTQYRLRAAELLQLAGETHYARAEAILVDLLVEQHVAHIVASAQIPITHMALASVYDLEHRSVHVRAHLESALAAEVACGCGPQSRLVATIFDKMSRAARDQGAKADAIAACEAGVSCLLNQLYVVQRDLATKWVAAPLHTGHRLAKSLNVVGPSAARLGGAASAANARRASHVASATTGTTTPGSLAAEETGFVFNMDAPEANEDTGQLSFSAVDPELLEVDLMRRFAAEAIRIDDAADCVSSLVHGHLRELHRQSELLGVLYGMVDGTDDVPLFAAVRSVLKEDTRQPMNLGLPRPVHYVSGGTISKHHHHGDATAGGRPSSAASIGSMAGLGSTTRSALSLSLAQTPLRRCDIYVTCATPAYLAAPAGGAGAAAAAAPDATRAAPLAMEAELDRMLFLDHLATVAAACVAEYQLAAALRFLKRSVVVAEDGKEDYGDVALAVSTAAAPTAPAVLRAASLRSRKNVSLVEVAITVGAQRRPRIGRETRRERERVCVA